MVAISSGRVIRKPPFALGVYIIGQSNAVGNNAGEGATPAAYLQGKLTFTSGVQTLNGNQGCHISSSGFGTNFQPLEWGVNSRNASASAVGCETSIAYNFVTHFAKSLWMQKVSASGLELTQWSIGGSQYSNFVTGMNNLRAQLLKYSDNPIVILVVIQGEAETINGTLAAQWKSRMDAVLTDLVSGGSTLPNYVITETLSASGNNATHMATVNAQKASFVADDPIHRFLVSDTGIGLVSDNVHYSVSGQEVLGQRIHAIIRDNIIPQL